MSRNNVKRLEFRLNPGIALRVNRSDVVVRFHFGENYFKDYIKTKTNNLPENYRGDESVDGSAHGLPTPRWLLNMLISILKERVDFVVEDECPTSSNNETTK